jgi:beta-mannosidase
VVADVIKGNRLADRSFYWLNYTQIQGSLFSLPRTSLDTRRHGDSIVVTNTGDLPAVGVHFQTPGITDVFSCAESFIWLDPGEQRPIRVSHQDELIQAAAWNADPA